MMGGWLIMIYLSISGRRSWPELEEGVTSTLPTATSLPHLAVSRGNSWFRSLLRLEGALLYRIQHSHQSHMIEASGRIFSTCAANVTTKSLD